MRVFVVFLGVVSLCCGWAVLVLLFVLVLRVDVSGYVFLCVCVFCSVLHRFEYIGVFERSIFSLG